jgi:hypothetical protein
MGTKVVGFEVPCACEFQDREINPQCKRRSGSLGHGVSAQEKAVGISHETTDHLPGTILFLQKRRMLHLTLREIKLRTEWEQVWRAPRD